jgi:hypothetical protein
MIRRWASRELACALPPQSKARPAASCSRTCRSAVTVHVLLRAWRVVREVVQGARSDSPRGSEPHLVPLDFRRVVLVLVMGCWPPEASQAGFPLRVPRARYGSTPESGRNPHRRSCSRWNRRRGSSHMRTRNPHGPGITKPGEV